MNKSGIYALFNEKNNEVYLGSAKNIANRWSTHKSQIISNKHKYFNNIEDVKFVILEEISDDDERYETEERYIEFLQRQDYKIVNKQKIVNSRKTPNNTENMSIAQSGGNNGNARLTDKDVRKIRKRYDDGEELFDIAFDYEISISHTLGIGNGTKWSSVI